MLERRQRAKLRSAAGVATETDLQVVLDAAATGTPPPDPALRWAAISVLREQLYEHNSWRTVTLVVFALLTTMCVVCALVSSPLWLLGLAVFGVAAFQTAHYPTTLQRRIDGIVVPTF